MSICCLNIQSTTSCLEILLFRLLWAGMLWELPLYFLFTPHPATNPSFPCLPTTTFPCLIVLLMASYLNGSNGPVATPLRIRTHPSTCNFELSITPLREVWPYEPTLPHHWWTTVLCGSGAGTHCCCIFMDGCSNHVVSQRQPFTTPLPILQLFCSFLSSVIFCEAWVDEVIQMSHLGMITEQLLFLSTMTSS